MKRLPASRTLLAALIGGSLTLACDLPPVHAQAQTGAAGTQALLEKAHLLETRNRLDMAAQTWQQVLLSDPSNTEALAGLARAAKVAGNAQLSNSYIERLRAINPNDPGIARTEKVSPSQGPDTTLLTQAGKYAQAGQYDQAMVIYHKFFSNQPPAGDWALAYYETEAATEDGRPHAISGLHALVDKYPTDSRYQIALGRILTYSPKTRAEGRRYLEKHPSSPQATDALRQSLVWDVANPASAPEIRAYLAKHNDPQLAQALRDMPAKPAPTRANGKPGAPAPAPDTPEVLEARKEGVEMESAYRTLNGKHLDDADARFKAILSTHPDSARALAGLGYIRMQQSNFASAVSFLEQAKQNGAKDPGLDSALQTARFWTTMGDASTALNENDLSGAQQQFEAALQLKPNSAEATEGLAGTLLKAQQITAAAELYERVIKLKPADSSAWRGLFQSYYNEGNAPQALQVESRIPAAIKSQLMRDPEFLPSLASAYSAVGRDADAQRVLRTALELPFPADSGNLKVGTELQYAALLQAANHLDQAGALYRQVLGADPTNASAWQGLVRVQHAMHADPQALQTIASMPLSVRDASMHDTGFESTVASIEQATNHLESAQTLLENIVAQDAAANQKPSVGLELQLAGIYIARNNTARAYPIYRQVLAENPDHADAWKGILTALHGVHRDQEALAQAQQIPRATRQQLELDPEYLQTIGSIYNALGQPQEAALFIDRVQQHYAAQHTAAPADIDVQDAWLLFNSGNDSGLYRQLMQLGSRPDLSDEQRRTVQTIWTNWAVRRANQAAANGDGKRSLAILNASAKAFPDNPGVLRALASGYARAGLPKQSVAIYKAQDMTAATASDYKAAVGAALATSDQHDAEMWLRYGLESYPRDAELLGLGAKFEQVHGNNSRAADYFKASLAALPPADPGAELAGELSTPAPAVRLPSAAQPQDLATLLGGPDSAAPTAAQTAAPRPYLPSYNNMSGQAPVDLPTNNAYPAGATVPSYPSNPSTYTTTPSSYPSAPAYPSSTSTPGGSTLPPTSTTTLGNYVPRASAEPNVPLITSPAPTSATLHRVPGLSAEDARILENASAATRDPLRNALPRSTDPLQGTPTQSASTEPVTLPPFAAAASLATTSHQAATLSAEDTRILQNASARTRDPLQSILPRSADPVQSTRTESASTPTSDPLRNAIPRSLPPSQIALAPTADQDQLPNTLPSATSPRQAASTTASDLLRNSLSRTPAPLGNPTTSYPLQSAVPSISFPIQSASLSTPEPLRPLPPAIQTVSSQSLYGDFTPDVTTSTTARFTPAPVPVQLGSNAHVIEPSTTEITDVLPTARYLPGDPFQPEAQSTSSSNEVADVTPSTHYAAYRPQPDGASRSQPDSTDHSQSYSTSDPDQQYPQPDFDAPRRRTYTAQRRRRTPASLPRPTARPYSAQRAPVAPTPAPSLNYPNAPSPLTGNPYPTLPPAPSEGTPPSDADLVARNVPPLRGSYMPGAAATVPLPKTEREQTESELNSLEASYSGWVGGTGIARYRSGTPGFDRLVDIEAPVEASAVIGKSLRATIVPRPVFLNSGVVNTASFAGDTGTIPVLGTLPLNAATTPTQQFSSGIGGELQLTTANFGIAVGYTPYTFLVSNMTARLQWRISHLTFFGDRDAVRDTQLSYAGLRDPASIGPLYSGNVWGGVIYTNGGARIDVGGEKSGFYLSGNGGTLTGYHVLDNKREEGTMGAYFRIHDWPGYGHLNVGGSFYATHYDHNEQGLTYGQGGYFSPNVYFLASIPFTFAGSTHSDFHYTVNGAVGVQTFQEAAAVYYPLDPATQLDSGNHSSSLFSDTGLNYAISTEESYRIADHWYIGGFASANNTRSYNTFNGGFFVRYLFKQQADDDSAPSGLFPTTGFRPLRVP